MAEPEIPWSQYDQAYKRINERLAEILAQLSTAKDPAKYLPVRLSDGSAFYNAGGGAGGGLVQDQIRNEDNTDWVNEPFVRKVQLTHAGAEIDPRQIRALTEADVITIANQILCDADGHAQVDVLTTTALRASDLNLDMDKDLQVDVKTLPCIPAGNNNIGDVDIASLSSADISKIRWGITREPAWTNGSNQTAPTTTTDLVAKTVGTGKTGRIFGWRISSPETNEFILNIGATAYRLAALGGAGLIVESHSVPVFDSISSGATIDIRVASNGGSGKVYRADLLYDEA